MFEHEEMTHEKLLSTPYGIHKNLKVQFSILGAQQESQTCTHLREKFLLCEEQQQVE